MLNSHGTHVFLRLAGVLQVVHGSGNILMPKDNLYIYSLCSLSRTQTVLSLHR